MGKDGPVLATGDPLEGGVLVEEDIDRLSNQVPTLLRQGNYDEAEAVCRRLEVEYPDQADGIERRAEVEEARKRWASAAEFYRKAAARHLELDPEYGREPAERCSDMARKMDEARAAERDAEPRPSSPS